MVNSMAFKPDTLGPVYNRARAALKNDAARRTLDYHIAEAAMHQAVADTVAGDMKWRLVKKTKRDCSDAEYELSATAHVRTLDREEVAVPMLLHITPHPHADSADQYWQSQLYFGVKELDFFEASIDVPYHTLRHMNLPGVNLYEPLDLD